MSTPPMPRWSRSFSGKLSPVTSTPDRIRARHAAHASGSEPPARKLPEEIGGREGPEPTRFGDWELRGRCIDF